MSAATTERPARWGVEQARERLLGGPSEITGESWRRAWLPLLVVTAIGGFLRFWRLGEPHQLVFDETYYVKQGWSLLQHGVELRNDASIPTPDALFTAGTPDVFGTEGDFVVHPPVGKWMIALGQWLFGVDSSFGWRFAAALVGTLSILLVGRVARRVFRSTVLGVTAAVLLATDGLHFVQSRTSLLDVFLSWWVLVAFACLLVDRDHARERLARSVAERGAGGLGPRLGWRPWRLAAGVSLGLACGVKWSGIYVLAVFGLMTVLWDAGARRAVGVRSWLPAAAWRDGVPAFLTMVPVAVAVYVATWAGWFASDDGWDRQWGAQHPSSGPGDLVPDALRSLWHYHQQAYDFHVGLDSPHPYSANPWSWLVQGRPTSFFYEAPELGQQGCEVAECSKAITSLGTPVLWWAGVVALVVLLWWWALRRDWRAGAVLAGYAATYLPWFQYQHRTIFTFYAVVLVPFVVLGVVFALGLLLGPDPGAAVLRGGVGVEAALRRRRRGALAAGVVVVACVACFAFFWPVYTGQVVPYEAWQDRMWLPSWV
ncbi:phospholipid carrier-dependent glycosyltransferase [Paenibacillus sp. TRM 82003]|uniref:dolichyl-phosphate-mannose--protein mannosyltransferase n=1 Tax=Kineococcus sp. TRM81007 TaxID=2925831 RepID=UPI001F55B308|nr:phospholipid carrier-dependent glycosyltransferase [Kineococcus sp. TRM81007]MCI2239889.1 phospholipid carrier-dependent glycosyltransferase [Kineococcus sp. TRM81007]MCI3925807.1 phospholipid carrier-dependent glycosyltransferase [Paenibacillus sp. TRM 82003]